MLVSPGNEDLSTSNPSGGTPEVYSACASRLHSAKRPQICQVTDNAQVAYLSSFMLMMSSRLKVWAETLS